MRTSSPQTNQPKSKLHIVLALIGISAFAWSAEAETNSELVRALLKPETRVKAFQELNSRTDKKDAASGTLKYVDPEIVICPQSNGGNIYVVLCDQVVDQPQSKTSFGTQNFDRLFPTPAPSPMSTSFGLKRNKAIFAFNERGKKIRPFGANDFLNGCLFDIDNDGFIERVDSMTYGFDDDFENTCEILEVQRVAQKKAKTLLRLVLNENDHAFGWDLKKENARYVLQIGPKGKPLNQSQLRQRENEYHLTKVIAEFRWNEATDRYDGPDGSVSDHFLRLDSETGIEAELSKRKRGPRFAPIKQPIDDQELPPASSVAFVPSPWVYKSLAGKSDRELLLIMTQGRSESDAEHELLPPEMLPDGFWEMSPKEAALAVARANERESFKTCMQLALDDLDNVAPPPRGEVGFDWSDSFCMNARPQMGRSILKWNGERSSLSFSRVDVRGLSSSAQLKAAIRKTETISITPELARTCYETIWWLSRLRTRFMCNETGSMFSTADGSAKFWVTPNQPSIEITLYSGSISERWMHEYDRETFANFAWHILSRLQRKLGVAPQRVTAAAGNERFRSPNEKFVEQGQPPDPGNPIETKKWIDRMISILKSGKEEYLYQSVVGALTPVDQPNRYQDPLIDNSLLEFVTEGLSASPDRSPKDGYKFINTCCAARALARRGNPDIFPLLIKLCEKAVPDGSSPKGDALEGAAYLVATHPEFRPQFVRVLEGGLANINNQDFWAADIFDAIWISHCTELVPRLEKLATASVEEIESRRAHEWSASSLRRFHQARRILTAWKEEDALTRAKLAALIDIRSYGEIQVSDYLRSQYRALAPERQKDFEQFLNWLSENTNRDVDPLRKSIGQ